MGPRASPGDPYAQRGGEEELGQVRHRSGALDRGSQGEGEKGDGPACSPTAAPY